METPTVTPPLRAPSSSHFQISEPSREEFAPLIVENVGFRFLWDWKSDKATLTNTGTGKPAWKGSLLPVLCTAEDYVRPRVLAVGGNEDRKDFSLGYGDFALARLEVEVTDYGVAFRRLVIEWLGDAVPLRGLFIGAGDLTERERQATPEYGATAWPDWKAEGFCVPGAKTNPGQSFWRFWDMGNAVLPLGSFGPAMGTPYTAAFPRPVLAAAMGGPDGWLAFGPGAIPDAALSLDIKSSSAWLRFWMREDLWGAPEGPTRTWEEPLRLTWHEDAWEAISRLYDSFPCPSAPPSEMQHSVWCTWGNFKEGRYDLAHEKSLADSFAIENLQLDDGWETWLGSGKFDEKRFPDGIRFLESVRQQGGKVAFWQAIGWVDRPEETELDDTDFLCGPDGKPRLGHWGCDPRSDQPLHYCIDPASERARNFLTARTRRLVRDYHPALLKLDFGYGMAGPDGAASRNPAFRGERLCFELLRIIVEAARAEDPSVAIELYGIHPLFRPLYDILALDDLGDMGVHEIEGHHQRSVWAALTARQGAGIMASSGYYWSALEEILLNTAILGAPGGCLPAHDATGAVATPRLVCRFRALSHWHRRTIGWEPVWLNSHRGNIHTEPHLHCWGRSEAGQITALALRESAPKPDLSAWGITSWSGRWAILSLDNSGVDHGPSIVCIPFDEGHLDIAGGEVSRVEYRDGTEQTLPIGATNSLRITSAALDHTMGFILTRPA
jgi:hypothetical protein